MVPVPPKLAFAEPVKIISAPAVSPLVLKFKVPLLVRFPPTDSTCVVTEPDVEDRSIPPLFINTSDPIVSVRGVKGSNSSMPEIPCPTVRL